MSGRARRASTRSTVRLAVHVALAVAAGSCVAEDPEPPMSAGIAAQLDAVLENAVTQGRVPGVVALVTSGDSVLYRSAAGVMDAEAEVPMRADALFVIASMTKPVTSLGVMMLVDEGRVELDEPVVTYLPEFGDREVLVALDSVPGVATTRAADRPVTVRDLLRHTSGLGYTFSSPRLLAWSQATGEDMLEQPLLHDPGAEWTYGTSTYFLGRIVEEVTGEGLDDFFQARILAPLGMTDTSFDLPEGEGDRLAALYSRTDAGLVGQSQAEVFVPAVRGDYGLLSTADDYARFIRLILGEGATGGVRLMSPETAREMTSDQLDTLRVQEQPAALPAFTRPFPMGAGRDGFGLGFQVAAGETEGRAPGSLSWAGLYNTHFWIDPAHDLGVVILTQLLPFNDEGVVELLRAFEGALYEGID